VGVAYKGYRGLFCEFHIQDYSYNFPTENWCQQVEKSLNVLFGSIFGFFGSASKKNYVSVHTLMKCA